MPDRPIAIDREAIRQRLRRAFTHQWKWSVDDDKRLRVDGVGHVKARYVQGETLPWNELAEGVAAAAICAKQIVPGERANPEDLVDAWVADAGLVPAIDVLSSMKCAAIWVTKDTMHVVLNGGGQPILNDGLPLWTRLREHLGHADARAYSVARKHALALREKAPLHVRCTLSYLFPAEPEWAALDAKDGLGGPNKGFGPVPDDIGGLLFASLDDLELARELAAENLGVRMAADNGLLAALVSRFGERALPVLDACVSAVRRRAGIAQALSQVSSEGAAEIMLRLVGDEDANAEAVAYLMTNAEVAIPALAAALGASKQRAKLLGPLLVAVVAQQRRLALRIAASAPPKVRAALEAAGATSRWMPKKIASISALMAEPLANASPSVQNTWNTVATWLETGADAEGASCLDEAAKQGEPLLSALAILARRCANADALACALAVVDAIASIAEPTTIRLLSYLSSGATRAELSDHAERALKRLQTALNLSDEERNDWAVPDYGLRDLALDFGPRSFAVRFDETFTLTLWDSAGAKVRTLPKPNKKDDASKSARAVEAWAVLKANAPGEARHQARRLEEAMVQGRSWPTRVFLSLLVPHPIFRELTRRIVWSRMGGELFRVAEDLSLADQSDSRFELTEADRIRAVHPIEASPERLAAFHQLFADYEILQPFEQLGRSSPDGNVSAIQACVGRHLTRGGKFALESLGFTDEGDYMDPCYARKVRGHEMHVFVEGPADVESPRITTIRLGSESIDQVALYEFKRSLARVTGVSR